MLSSEHDSTYISLPFNDGRMVFAWTGVMVSYFMSLVMALKRLGWTPSSLSDSNVSLGSSTVAPPSATGASDSVL